MLHKSITVALPAIFATVAAGCSQQIPNQQATVGSSNEAFKLPADPFGWPIVDGMNRRVGTVFTRLNKQGKILVMLDTAGLPQGPHGAHVHEVAKCDPPAFESAGAHWNWTRKQHGHKNPKGHHAGDLGNLTVGPNGKGQATFLVDGKDWDPKAKGPLSLVIHASPDDNLTDPNGDSGARIACGTFYLRRD